MVQKELKLLHFAFSDLCFKTNPRPIYEINVRFFIPSILEWYWFAIEIIAGSVMAEFCAIAKICEDVSGFSASDSGTNFSVFNQCTMASSVNPLGDNSAFLRFGAVTSFSSALS